MKEEDIDLLEKHGWTVECESPFEIRHEDGSFATNRAATIVLVNLQFAEMSEDDVVIV